MSRVQKPEARSYYELSASPISFKFPEPGYLEGVKTKDKAILKVRGLKTSWAREAVGKFVKSFTV